MSPVASAQIATARELVREFHAISPAAAVEYVARLRKTAEDFVANEPGTKLTHAFSLTAVAAEAALKEASGGAL
ncbi:MAG TPA: hypothetical protein VK453_25115 [Micromonosporaceae bacterium]|nr:hypothetical protein [Micromonosporaceae bacterium]